MRKSYLKEQLVTEFYTIPYPGNDAIPRPDGDYYTYGGEIPWSSQFGRPLRDESGSVQRNIQQAFSYWTGQEHVGISVEIPIWDFNWESYHSQLNQINGITTLAPALCESLGLSNRRGEWDLYDSAGNLATLYRHAHTDDKSLTAHFLYIRTDLLNRYLSITKQTIVWLLWGERGFVNFRYERVEQLRDIYSAYAHLHRQAYHFV